MGLLGIVTVALSIYLFFVMAIYLFFPVQNKH
ncbi:potassium-transporting ATPase subunit F [Fischerella thermalis]|uniref:Potassium-transporting ATPase subunit F n=1 Tax=Fischerella thermalis CCMEE 5268 TaxID=2019662 RepID=A0A2N6KKM3_9CYAN|nr:potassium-transporting ATPase subunit F [Fischerella thermalis]PMB00290.1 hypothetical protein CEN50_03895 [Fischerella thermalis CCMEE 5268]